MGEIRFVGTGETRGYPYLVCKKVNSRLNRILSILDKLLDRFSFKGSQDRSLASPVFRIGQNNLYSHVTSTEMEYRLTWLSYWYTDRNSAQKTMD